MDNHPSIVRVDREGMKALEAIAKANMDASAAQANVAALRATETEYIAEREGKAGAAVDRVLAESEAILEQASENSSAVVMLSSTASDVAAKVSDIVLAVRGVLERFDQKSALWEQNMQDRENKLADEKKGLIARAAAIAAERKTLDTKALELVRLSEDIESRRQDVEKMITNKNV